MDIISAIIKGLGTSRIKQIEFFRKNPIEIQERSFFHLIRKASLSEWGRKYSYSSVSSVREFQSRVPVQTYEDMIPWIERIGRGEENLLWPGRTRWFAKSSGTTSAKSKYIPISSDALNNCHFRAAKDTILIYLMNNPSSSLLRGKALTLGGSHKIGQFSNNILYGDLSAILIENTPFYAEMKRTPKRAIALTEDFEKKLELITRTTVNCNVTSMAGVPSWFLTLIKYILSYTGKSDLHEIWPNLEVFFHGGISFSPYREIFHSLIPGNHMHYMETYNASEGFFGIQDDPSCTDMLIMPDYGIFYEFIPADKTDTDFPPACTLEEIETGINYAMIISTNGGLWRYMIGDTVMFSSRKPYRFHITGRTKQFINAFGEEVIVDNADKAIEYACKETGATINDYTAGPVFMGEKSKGSHEWLVEFENEPADILQFAELLDNELKSLNSDYEAKRYKDLNLIRPVVRCIPKGTFHKWLKSKNKLGGQNKVPRLSNNRDYIEEIYRILED